jgi:hypothetical protein
MTKGLTRGDQHDVNASRRSEQRLRIVGADGCVDSPVTRRELMVAIEDQIVPRLFLAHAAAPTSQSAEKRPSETVESLPTQAEIRELANIAVCQDLSAAIAFVESVCERGVAIDTVLLRLVEPAAHALKSQWESDLRTFTEVTIGRGTLQLLIHVVGARFAHVALDRGLVILAASPSERLSLGIYVYEEFLRRDGCELLVEPDISKAALLALIGSQRVAMLGISVTRADISEPLASLVAAAKKTSLNPAMAVVLNGAADLSDAAAHVGAGLCSDPRYASQFLDADSRTPGESRRR